MKVCVSDIKNGAKCTTMQIQLDDILVMNPMRDAMIEFLKATLSAGFRTKKLHFSCIKTTKNSKIIISLHILTILHIKNPFKSFNKFPKNCEKNVKNNVKSLIFHQFSQGKPTCRKIFPLYKQPDENYNQFINLH